MGLFAPKHNNTFNYDAVGNRTVKQADGARTMTVYDAANQIDYRGRNGVGSRFGVGNRTSFTYNSNGQQIAVKNSLGNCATTVFDAASQPVAQINPLGQYRNGKLEFETGLHPVICLE